MIEETLPTPESVCRLLHTQRSIVNCVGELVEVQHSVVPPVHRYHEVDEEITKDVSGFVVFDGHEIDIPRVISLCPSVDNGPVRLRVSDPTGIRKAHAEIEQNERPLKECSSRPRLEGLRQLELIRHHACMPS